MNETSLLGASQLRWVVFAACLAASAVACTEEGDDPATSGTIGGAGASPGAAGGTGGPPGAATTGGVAPGVAGGGGTTGVVRPGGFGGSTPGGFLSGGGTTGAGGGTTGAGGGLTGGSTSGDNGTWCKAKAVFDARCVACHDGMKTAGAPMALKTFADLSADSAQYPGTKTFTRALTRMKATTAMMPPTGGLTATEIQAVEAWIQGGAQSGADSTCAVAGGGTTGGGASSADEWPSDCDGTYKILAHDTTNANMPYRMPRGTETHPGFTFDAPWGSDQVQAIAMRPVTDNKAVLHHWILYQNSGTRAFLTGWAPGQDASKRKMRPDVGMYLPSGPKSLYLDMHYNSLQASKEELDRSGVEICVVKKPKFRPNTATVYMGFVGFGFPMVPANASNYNLTATCTVSGSTPVHLLTASPHAHKLAVHMKFTARVGGRDIVMHDAPFDFNEQTSHPLDEDVVLNAGDTVTTTCTFTNPTNRDIQFSENTDGEMCFNFAVYYPMGALSCGGLGGLLGGGGGTGAGGFLGGLLGI
jgi:Copper type II ascorbate-dependent monooxygenase, C-terminal domain/Cytochrome c